MLYRWEWIWALLLSARPSLASQAQTGIDDSELANDKSHFQCDPFNAATLGHLDLPKWHGLLPG